MEVVGAVVDDAGPRVLPVLLVSDTAVVTVVCVSVIAVALSAVHGAMVVVAIDAAPPVVDRVVAVVLVGGCQKTVVSTKVAVLLLVEEPPAELVLRSKEEEKSTVQGRCVEVRDVVGRLCGAVEVLDSMAALCMAVPPMVDIVTLW